MPKDKAGWGGCSHKARVYIECCGMLDWDSQYAQYQQVATFDIAPRRRKLISCHLRVFACVLFQPHVFTKSYEDRGLQLVSDAFPMMHEA